MTTGPSAHRVVPANILCQRKTGRLPPSKKASMSGQTKIRIDSLSDFRGTLAETISLVQRLMVESSGFPVYENIIGQLEAMSRWTKDDRVPTMEERNSI